MPALSQPATTPPSLAQLQNEMTDFDVCTETNFQRMWIEPLTLHGAPEPILPDPEAKAETLKTVVKRRCPVPSRMHPNEGTGISRRDQQSFMETTRLGGRGN